MSTSYPTGLDSYSNPTATSPRNNPSHASQHANINDAVAALETKVGIDSSAVTATIDYKLKNTASIDPGHHHTNTSVDSIASTKITGVTFPASGLIVGTTDTQTLTNKTLTTPIISTISNTGTLTLPTSTDTLVGKATTDTLTNKTLTSPVISSISNTGTVTLPTATDTLVARATTDTLTNKRVTKRAPAVTQSATPTINTDNTDVAHITGLAQAITSMTTNLSGTPVEGDTLRIDITDNGTARAITWGAKFESSGTVTLPATTVLSVRLDVGFVWNTVTSAWRCVAIA